MSKNTKKALIYTLSILIFIIIIAIIVIVVALDEKEVTEEPFIEETPVITEDFNLVNLNLLKDYSGNIYIDENNDIIEADYNSSYYIGTFGKLYTNKIEIQKNNIDEEYIIKDHVIKTTSDGYMYFTHENNKSNLYDRITPIYFHNDQDNSLCNYLLLTNCKNSECNLGSYQIYNLIDKTYANVDNRINSFEYYYSNDYYIYENSYLPFKAGNKYVLIDFNGQIVYESDYEYIDNISERHYVFKQNGFYGIMDSKFEVVVGAKYETINYVDGYYILIKDNLLSVLNENFKVLVNNNISVVLEDFTHLYKAHTKNNILYLQTYKSKRNLGNDILYIINNKGIVRKQQGNYKTIEDDNGNILYFFDVVYSNNTLAIHYYDSDLYEYYVYTTPTLSDLNSYEEIDKLMNGKYHEIEFKFKDGTSNTIYIDLFNSREISLMDLKYKYFENGYGFVLNDGKLDIYKEKELLESFDNVEYYLGGYMFSSGNKIFKVEFKKDSN